MDDVRPVLKRIGDRVSVPEPAHERLLIRRDRQRRQERILALTVSLLVIALAGAAAVAISSDKTAGRPEAPLSPSPSLPGPVSHELVSGVNRALEPGRYWLDRDDAYISFTVPAGWNSFGGFGVAKPDGSAVSVWSADRVPADPCAWKGRQLDPGTSVDGLMTALSRQPGVSRLADAMIAGFSAQELLLRLPTAMGGKKLDGCDETVVRGRSSYHHEYIRWFAGDAWFAQAPGQSDRVWILDVRGARIMIVASSSTDTQQRSMAQIESIVRSIGIT